MHSPLAFRAAHLLNKSMEDQWGTWGYEYPLGELSWTLTWYGVHGPQQMMAPFLVSFCLQVEVLGF